MPRHSLVEFDDASMPVQAVYSDYLCSTNSYELPNWLKSLGHSEIQADALWHNAKTVMLQGELPLVVKELVIFIVSVTNGSPYCSSAHAHALLSLDSTLTYDDLVKLTKDRDSVPLPPASRAAIDFAVKVAVNPVAVEDADFDRLTACGFSQTQISELLEVITLGNTFNTYAITMQLPLDKGYAPILQEAA